MKKTKTKTKTKKKQGMIDFLGRFSECGYNQARKNEAYHENNFRILIQHKETVFLN